MAKAGLYRPLTGSLATQRLGWRRGSVEIRPVRPTDARALADFYRSLSAESRQLRFLGARAGLTVAEADDFATVDHQRREGLVAVLRHAGPRDGAIVAHLCLEPAGPGHIELGVAVADALQHHHIGLALVRAGMAWARRHGIRVLDATARTDNASMLGLARAMGAPLHIGAGSVGELPFSLDLGRPASTGVDLDPPECLSREDPRR